MASYYNYNDTTPPVVVQGVAVKHQHQQQSIQTTHRNHPTNSNNHNDDDDDEPVWTKGEHQPKRCNDAAFAVLFYVHLGAMAWTTAAFAPRMAREVAESHGYNYNDYNDNDNGRYLKEETTTIQGAIGRMVSWAIRRGQYEYHDYYNNHDHDSNGDRELQEDNGDAYSFDATTIGTDDIADMLLLLAVSAGIALLISTLALTVMIRHAQSLIKFALIFNIATVALFTVGSLFLSPFAAVIGMFLLGMTTWYAYVVWGRIPFAACNLVTATTAVKANLGLSILAYSTLILMFGWSGWWMVSFVSTVYVTSGCDGEGACESEANGVVLFLLFLSGHWTVSVIRNTVHVTVAGVGECFACIIYYMPG